MTVEKITEIDEKYMDLDINDYNCVAVVTSYTYNSEGTMFEYTQSRHRPDYFRFQDKDVYKRQRTYSASVSRESSSGLFPDAVSYTHLDVYKRQA